MSNQKDLALDRAHQFISRIMDSRLPDPSLDYEDGIGVLGAINTARAGQEVKPPIKTHLRGVPRCEHCGNLEPFHATGCAGQDAEPVGEIDEGDEGAFVELYPDNTFTIGQKVYTHPPAQPAIPTNDELERLYEDQHSGHIADFAADVLERWGGWQEGILGYGGKLSAQPDDGLLFIPCNIHKAPELKDGQVVVCLVDGKQERLKFSVCPDGEEYWWLDSQNRIASPSHYSLWGIPFPDAVFSPPNKAPTADGVPNQVGQGNAAEIEFTKLSEWRDVIGRLINDYGDCSGRHHVSGFALWNEIQMLLVDAGKNGFYDGVLPGDYESRTPPVQPADGVPEWVEFQGEFDHPKEDIADEAGNIFVWDGCVVELIHWQDFRPGEHTHYKATGLTRPQPPAQKEAAK